MHQVEQTHQIIAEVAQDTLKRRGVCPTCGSDSTFSYLGEQRWPEKVARAAGLPIVVQLWTCDCCQTSVTQAPDD